MCANKQLSNECKKRLVIKNVLADPFKIDWPTLNSEVENQVVEKLSKIISPVGKYRLQSNIQARATRKKQKVAVSKTNVSEKPVPPLVLNQFSFGLREILRGLGGNEQTSNGPISPVFNLIFACHEDVDPSILITDVLTLALQKGILVCGLSKGTAQKLGLALGQPRVTCLGIKCNASEFSEIVDLLAQKLGRRTIPWCSIKSDSEMQQEYEPVLRRTRIKRLRTFAPILSKTAESKKKSKS